MSSNATQKKAHADAIPYIVGNWALAVSNDPPVSELNSLQISFQEPGETLGRIFGSVRSSPPDITAYAIENGEVTNTSEVSFDVTKQNTVYTFTGRVDGASIKGSVTQPSDGPWKEEGSWSAQAQGGGEEEEEEKKHPRKHTKRCARQEVARQ